MKISWKPRPGQTGSSLVLGDDALGLRVNGSKVIVSAGPVSHQWQNQPAAYPDAEDVEHFDRGNCQTVYAAIIDYQFDTIGKCDQWLYDVANQFDGGGTLEVTFDGGGQSSMEAVIDSIQRVSRAGCCLVLQYTFLGGRFSAGPAVGLPTNQVPIP